MLPPGTLFYRNYHEEPSFRGDRGDHRNWKGGFPKSKLFVPFFK